MAQKKSKIQKLTWCDSLARNDLNAQPTLVQMLHEDGTSGQCRHQIDLALVQQIVVFALKPGVRLLLDFKNHIASQNTRCLVTLSAELNALTTLYAPVDVHMQHLAVDDSLLASTLLAAILVLDDLSLSVAVRARGLESLNHGTHLSHHRLHTVAITAHALLDGALLSTSTLALGADDGALQRQLGDLAAVDILERNLVGVVNCAGLGRALVAHAAAAKHASKSATATKELGKQVLGSHTTATASSAIKASLTHLIISSTFLGIGKDFVGVGNLFELVLGLGVARVLVCIMCQLQHRPDQG